MKDRGLQRERTTLAWHRTALSAAACAVLILGVSARQGWAVAAVPGILAAASSVGLAILGRQSTHPSGPGRGILLRAVAFAVTAACLAAVPLAL